MFVPDQNASVAREMYSEQIATARVEIIARETPSVNESATQRDGHGVTLEISQTQGVWFGANKNVSARRDDGCRAPFHRPFRTDYLRDDDQPLCGWLISSCPCRDDKDSDCSLGG